LDRSRVADGFSDGGVSRANRQPAKKLRRLMQTLAELDEKPMNQSVIIIGLTLSLVKVLKSIPMTIPVKVGRFIIHTAQIMVIQLQEDMILQHISCFTALVL
jgi:hypothetical protein